MCIRDSAYIDTITTTGLLTTGGNIVIPNAGNIGSAGDTDAIAIASNGVVTFSQAPVLTLGTAAQTNITSLGTLTALTVDDVAIDGKVVTMTGSSGDTATLTVGTNGTLDITTTDTAAAAANIQITADGTAELAGTTVTLDSGGGITLDADSGTITFADGGSSLGTITSDGFTGNVVGNVTGNTSGTAATVTTAGCPNPMKAWLGSAISCVLLSPSILSINTSTKSATIETISYLQRPQTKSPKVMRMIKHMASWSVDISINLSFFPFVNMLLYICRV